MDFVCDCSAPINNGIGYSKFPLVFGIDIWEAFDVVSVTYRWRSLVLFLRVVAILTAVVDESANAECTAGWSGD